VAALPPGDVTELLDLISDCESDGKNVPNYINDSMHTAFGPWQITNTTWRAYGGTEFGQNARYATIDEQRIVATRILAARPSGADWDPSKHCWGPRMQAALNGQNVTNIHPTGGPGSEAIGGGGAAPAPAPAPQANPAPPAAESGPTYTVRQGDRLGRIAAANGTTALTLANLNGLANPDLIFPGQVLRLAGATPAPAADTSHGHDHDRAEDGADGSYTVRPGDELRDIAREVGMHPRDIARINNLSNPNLIFPGQVLRLGGQGPAGALAAVSNPGQGWGPQVLRSINDISDASGITNVITRNGHSPSRDRAADFMVGIGNPAGDRILQYVLANRQRLGIEYVIWQQRIYGAWTGWGPKAMENRGSATANHMDHVHVAFLASFTYAGGAATPPAAAPAPAPAPAPQAPVSGGAQQRGDGWGRGGGEYRVQRGDTLQRIAERNGTNWRAIYDANRDRIGGNPDWIREGMTLVLVTSDGTRNLFGATPAVR
jgi:nucleoid-associated protein YgaU